jgi:hypothetical protein
MSIYHFVRGPRLFIQAAREDGDPDAVNQNPEDEMLEYGRDVGADASSSDIQRVHTQRLFNTESHSSAASQNRVARKGGLKSVTRKIIRKTTTLTRGEQRTVTESLVSQTGKDGKEVTVPKRFVTETVVRTPWGTTDDDEMDEGSSGGGAHSSGGSNGGVPRPNRNRPHHHHHHHTSKQRESMTKSSHVPYSNGHKSEVSDCTGERKEWFCEKFDYFLHQKVVRMSDIQHFYL